MRLNCLLVWFSNSLICNESETMLEYSHQKFYRLSSLFYPRQSSPPLDVPLDCKLPSQCHSFLPLLCVHQSLCHRVEMSSIISLPVCHAIILISPVQISATIQRHKKIDSSVNVNNSIGEKVYKWCHAVQCSQISLFLETFIERSCFFWDSPSSMTTCTNDAVLKELNYSKHQSR